MRKVIYASVIGNILEYYDFTIYSVFSLTLAHAFFPLSSSVASLLMSLAVFAVGFFMRPLGGIVFGYIGDHYGRRPSLMFSIFGMAVATFFIGCLPTYQQIGFAAPLLLVILRLIQGLTLGGEGVGSAIFLLEHAMGYRQGLVGGIAIASQIIGVLLAISIGLLLNELPPLWLSSWRYAFMLGGLLGVVGMYLRLKVTETPAFATRKSTDDSGQEASLFSQYGNAMLTVTILGGVTGAVAYFIMGYTNVLFVKFLGASAKQALIYTAIGTISYISSLPIAGLLSDHIGYQRTLRLGSLAIVLLALPLAILLGSQHTVLITLSLLIFGLLAALVCAPSYPAVMHLFPTYCRYRGLAISFNLGVALFGGTAPMIATYLIEKTHLLYAPSFYLMGVALLFLWKSYQDNQVAENVYNEK